MASEPTVTGTAGMDYNEHNSTYELFIRMTAVFTPVFLVWVVALAIGGVKGSWFWATISIVISCIAAVMGLFSKEMGWKPAMGSLVFSLICLLLV